MFVKCKLLKKDGLIKDVFTEMGDIKVMGGYPFNTLLGGTGKLKLRNVLKTFSHL